MGRGGGERTEFLGVRETAARLGVHENTVRNWVRDGILPTARVPGSRFHRFDVRDVERLETQRGQPVASVAREQSITIGPELVDATQLDYWAGTTESRSDFPELMRRLLAATPGMSAVSVRAGEGTSLKGWDGRVDSEGTPLLPKGPLCFEMGVGKRPKKKADEDWTKRCTDPRGVVTGDSSFIFVTPRRWASGDDWARERRAESIFRDVRVLDADDLEAWLGLTPAVHHWLSEHLGRQPSNAQTLETWWQRFSDSTNPPLPTNLFLAGRDKQQAELAHFLGGRPDVVVVQARWREDALAFVWATVEAMSSGGNEPAQTPLVVLTKEVWNRVVHEPGRMTLLPLFGEPDLKTAQDQGHFVVLPIGVEHVTHGRTISLPRVGREEAAAALKEVDVSKKGGAYELAGLARRNMPSLVRKLARDPRLERPDWSREQRGETLAPLVLVGRWTVGSSDTQIVSRLANEAWSKVELSLVSFPLADAPFVQVSSEWHLTSSEEAFLLLRDALTPDVLTRWRETVVEVLLEEDPRLDLPPDQRPLAGIRGTSRQYSSVLREGLAQGVALVGSIEGEQLRDGMSGADHARLVVRAILKRANDDPSGLTWHGLEDVLPLLAEAAPDAFLVAVHDDLDRPDPVLKTMFQDSDQGWSSLFGSSPHTGLLWALETLCWSPDSDCLLESVHALARLHSIDPGGRLSNRPLQSIENALVGWVRHTAAPLETKVLALEQTCRELPRVGWDVLLGLWPGDHSIAMPPHPPRFRDWGPESPTVMISEWIKFIGHLVDLATDLAGSEPTRWTDLIGHIAPLPPADRSRLIDALERFACLDDLSHSGRLVVWECLRREVAHHEQFASATWAMDAPTIARLKRVADTLEPKEAPERLAYLFDWYPDLPDVDRSDYTAYEKKLNEVREEALRGILAHGSITDLANLAERSPVPRHLGWSLAGVAPAEIDASLLRWLEADSTALRDAGVGWAARRMHQEGVAWLKQALTGSVLSDPDARIILALNAPPNGETWEVLDNEDPAFATAYWSQMHPLGVATSEASQAATNLLRHGRAWAAIDLLAMVLHRKDDPADGVSPDLVAQVLDSALATESGGARAQASYEVGVLLDYLERNGFPEARLVQYEFYFFRLLEHHRLPRALFKALGEDPALFVDLVMHVYRGKNEARREVSEQQRAMSHLAWSVLSDWNVPPGRREDGTIDQAHLERWVDDARLALLEADRADIGDEQIGQVLGRAASGDSDGIWPALPIRNLIERIGSTQLESGIHMGVFNSQGTTVRSPLDGGAQERERAKRYRDWATLSAGRWRRTSRLLRGLAEDYERQARREDQEAELRADTD